MIRRAAPRSLVNFSLKRTILRSFSNQTTIENLLKLYDVNGNGTLDHSDFLHMAGKYNLDQDHVVSISKKFFSNGDEELGAAEFGLLYQEVFDKNWDGVMQYPEFLELIKHIPIREHQVEEAKRRFFPTENTELQADKYNQLIEYFNHSIHQNKMDIVNMIIEQQDLEN